MEKERTVALITGATGFVGSHLADYLIDDLDIKVFGIKRHRSREEFTRQDVTYLLGDITDQNSMNDIVKKVQPDYVFHLAAQSYVPDSWRYPLATIECNIKGTVCLLEAIRKECPGCITHVAGSSEEYGFVNPNECPVDEFQPLRPFSPYGVSKVATDLLAQQYHKSYGMKTIITRAFNHEGPRRGELFVTSKIAKRLALIVLDKVPPIVTLGNLEAVRDFSDSRDIVKAYWLAVTKCNYGEPYNIGSGRGTSIQELVNLFQDIFKERDRAFTVEQDPSMMRPSDVPYLICDDSKFRMKTGWKPEIPLRQTMEDLLDYWIGRLK